MPTDTRPTIHLTGRAGGEDFAVLVPDDYALLEELFAGISGAQGLQAIRIYSAMIGLCTNVGRMARVDYAAHGFNALAYGRTVYSWLHKQGISTDEIIRAGAVLLPLVMVAAFPREAEVAESLGKSLAVAEG